MHFGTKSYLKSTRNHTAKHALNRLAYMALRVAVWCAVEVFFYPPFLSSPWYSHWSSQNKRLSSICFYFNCNSYSFDYSLFIWNYFLIVFYSISSLIIWFYLIFISNMVIILLIAIFLIEFVFQFCPSSFEFILFLCQIWFLLF